MSFIKHPDIYKRFLLLLSSGFSTRTLQFLVNGCAVPGCLSSRPFALLTLSMILTVSAYAQEENDAKDSLRSIASRINRVYPAVRPYSFQIDRVGDRPYNSNFLKQKMEAGEIDATLRTRTFLTFPSYKKRKFILYGTFTHLYQKQYLRDVENLSPSHPQYRSKRDVETHDLTLSIDGVYKDSLFGKTVVYTSALMLNSRNFKSVEKFRARFTGAIILKASQNTVMTAGIIALLDPSANLPFSPLFTYWHRFPNQWQFDFILPSRIYLRHPFNTGWFSVGTELATAHGFYTPDQTILTGDYEFSNLLLQPCVSIEYPVAKNLLLGFRTGAEFTLASRLVKINGKNSDYVSRTKSDPATFINLSLSFVPGLTKTSRK